MSDKHGTNATHVRIVYRTTGVSTVMTMDEYDSPSFDPGPFYSWDLELLDGREDTYVTE